MKDRKIMFVMAIWQCHGGDVCESGRIKSFIFLFILIEFWDLYYSNIFLRVEIDRRSLFGPYLHLRSS